MNYMSNYDWNIHRRLREMKMILFYVARGYGKLRIPFVLSIVDGESATKIVSMEDYVIGESSPLFIDKRSV